MTLLIFALIVCIIAALLVWAVSLVPMDTRLSLVVQIAVIIIAAVIIAQRAGLV